MISWPTAWTRLPLLGAGGWLLAWRCAVVAGAALLGVLLVRRKARRPLALAALALCALCYAGELDASTAGPTVWTPPPCRRPAA